MMRVVVMGVAGCGKSSVGEAVASQLGATYVDGDDLHPPANIAKMSAGTPLNDQDRAPWLDQIGAKLGASTAPLFIGCSALKAKYRDRIQAGAGAEIWFLHLSGDRAVIEKRMSEREGHFMPVSLLDSQFKDLEPLGPNERGSAIKIDQTFDAVVAACVASLKKDFG